MQQPSEMPLHLSYENAEWRSVYVAGVEELGDINLLFGAENTKSRHFIAYCKSLGVKRIPPSSAESSKILSAMQQYLAGQGSGLGEVFLHYGNLVRAEKERFWEYSPDLFKKTRRDHEEALAEELKKKSVADEKLKRKGLEGRVEELGRVITAMSQSSSEYVIANENRWLQSIQKYKEGAKQLDPAAAKRLQVGSVLEKIARKTARVKVVKEATAATRTRKEKEAENRLARKRKDAEDRLSEITEKSTEVPHGQLLENALKDYIAEVRKLGAKNSPNMTVIGKVRMRSYALKRLAEALEARSQFSKNSAKKPTATLLDILTLLQGRYTEAVSAVQKDPELHQKHATSIRLTQQRMSTTISAWQRSLADNGGGVRRGLERGPNQIAWSPNLGTRFPYSNVEQILAQVSGELSTWAIGEVKAYYAYCHLSVHKADAEQSHLTWMEILTPEQILASMEMDMGIPHDQAVLAFKSALTSIPR
ncbi:hypothetical protein ACTVZO_13430 [Streptomyces sp. IBSNAI002]|uniref:hypothetical protein n=1 Tax=Streptomyces sp. IBSNAI002 TaxID=3457500 RepID=UPI003FD69445